MAQLIVRNLEEDVKTKLKKRAAKKGRSTEEEVREILRNAVRESPPHAAGLGTRIARRFRGIGLTAPIEELRGAPARSADFDDRT